VSTCTTELNTPAISRVRRAGETKREWD